MSNTYVIQYWIEEEDREHGISHTVDSTWVDKDRAIHEAGRIWDFAEFACVEVISSDDEEGDDGIVCSISEDVFEEIKKTFVFIED